MSNEELVPYMVKHHYKSEYKEIKIVKEEAQPLRELAELLGRDVVLGNERFSWRIYINVQNGHITSMTIGGNQNRGWRTLESIPKQISKFKNLKKLDLSYNRIKKIENIPPGVEELNLYDNHLEEIDESELPPNLKISYFENNKFKIRKVPSEEEWKEIGKYIPQKYKKEWKILRYQMKWKNDFSNVTDDELGKAIEILKSEEKTLKKIWRSCLYITDSGYFARKDMTEGGYLARKLHKRRIEKLAKKVGSVFYNGISLKEMIYLNYARDNKKLKNLFKKRMPLNMILDILPEDELEEKINLLTSWAINDSKKLDLNNTKAIESFTSYCEKHALNMPEIRAEINKRAKDVLFAMKCPRVVKKEEGEKTHTTLPLDLTLEEWIEKRRFLSREDIRTAGKETSPDGCYVTLQHGFELLLNKADELPEQEMPYLHEYIESIVIPEIELGLRKRDGIFSRKYSRNILITYMDQFRELARQTKIFKLESEPVISNTPKSLETLEELLPEPPKKTEPKKQNKQVAILE